MNKTQEIIESAFEKRTEIGPKTVAADVKQAIDEVLAGLDQGTLRVAEKIGAKTGRSMNGSKKRFCFLSVSRTIASWTAAILTSMTKCRVNLPTFRRPTLKPADIGFVPPAAVRRGSYIASDVVVMPSFVNIGAYVDKGTMIDTWATVGSCAQIGKNVHLSGGRRYRRCARALCRPARPLSKTTALSVPAPKSWKASSSKKAR